MTVTRARPVQPAPVARFDTVLVANRGEIACRVIRSARRLGLRTVAVYSDADRAAPHVRLADRAVRIGPDAARESYLVAERLLDAAARTGAGAVHPGYGFLSEDAAFAAAVEDAGLVFVGPTPDQLAVLGTKHTARALALDAGVPVFPGTGLLESLEAALDAAEEIGYPVMLKATGGGGGIGLQACWDAAALRGAYARVERLASAHFASSGIFLERFAGRARHVEVQILGDGRGRALALADRDCTLQRRHQKVIEEAPAPGLGDALRRTLAASAVRLCAGLGYRSAGTVEFVVDASRGEASFLEVNARLQVEHPVTEELLGVDLVAAMLQLANGERGVLDDVAAAAERAGAVVGADGVVTPGPRHAVEARIYAEDPAQDHRPCAGLVTHVAFPDDVRVDGWVETGTEVGTSYDPLLAKVIVSGATRAEALDRLAGALARTRVEGIETNLSLLAAAAADGMVRQARHTTSTLAGIVPVQPRVDVVRGGTLTTVQDWPGRTGLWQVGVPPSGPMDDRSFRQGNRALGNPEGAPGLECTLAGPALRFAQETTVMVTGAPAPVTVDGAPVPQWEPVTVPPGGLLDIGTIPGPGLRAYLLVAGGLDITPYLGSASTFTLGIFGGHAGRALRTGDVLRATGGTAPDAAAVPAGERPVLGTAWEVGVTEGPHATPDFFTPEDIDMFYATGWEVHFNSARTGVRLIGPKPRWARPDGGEAGLHPSNIHDTPYAVGTVDFTGDVPIILGPDGPSLGGFVCPATVVLAERWKIGQLCPGDIVRFVLRDASAPRDGGVLGRRPARVRGARSGGGAGGGEADGEDAPEICYRRSGDDNLLVEYGPMTLDLGLRMRVHALAEHLATQRLAGIVDVTPGIRSLQIHVDPDVLPVHRLLAVVRELEEDLPATEDLRVPSRVVRLPLSWDDPATREAIARYMAGVRADAPWCPWNIEFIRRANGLASVDDVHRTVFDASYLVLGLGDVYLGAPVATPLDPRHRLVTTKYNPARTWTPENAVGIGGAYLCVYGMEGPGGYQFVGRTVQVWSRFRSGGPFEPGSPWLLRFFDRIQWYPVGAEELLDLRADCAAGQLDLGITPGDFSIAEHRRFLAANAVSIAAFRRAQSEAFAAEREAWAVAGEFEARDDAVTAPATAAVTVPPGGTVVEAPFRSSVWRVDVRPGEQVAADQGLLALEAMKLETVVRAPVDGEVVAVLVQPGAQVAPGAPLVVLVPRTGQHAMAATAPGSAA
jgi:urea carboxylase